MKIAIRLDDITPDMDFEKFNRFKALMDQYHVKPLIGVVPENRDPMLAKDMPCENFWKDLVRWQEEGWIIAMHGLHHSYTTKKGGLFPLNQFSEFAGLPYEKQNEMIREGRAILEKHGIYTDFFMAPAHSYDRNTLRALRENKFFRITDGFGDTPYTYEGMTFYPISFRMDKSLTKKDGATTLVVHVNTMNEKDFAKFEKIFKEQEMLPYPEYIYIPAKRRTALGHIIEFAMATMKRCMVQIMAAK